MIAYSIRFRLLFLAGMILLVSGLLVLFGALLYGRAAADRAFDQLLEGSIQQIAARIHVVEGEIEVDIPPSAFALLGLAGDERVFLNIIDQDGQSLRGFDTLSIPYDTNRTRFEDSHFQGYPVRIASFGKVVVEDGYSGQIGIFVAQTIDARKGLAHEITWRAMLVLGAMGAIVLALLWLAIHSALRPLRALESELLARDPLDFSPLQTHVPNEMETFVASMNRFLRRLKRRVDVIERFVADSAHQIRTPIAALKATADLPIDATHHDALLENKKRLQKQVNELSRLADQLMTQTLISHRADTVLEQIVDLRLVAFEAEKSLRAMRLWADDAIQLELCEAEALQKGDGFSLREAVKNLVNNALEYGKMPVKISVEPNSITVKDCGAGFDQNSAKMPQNKGLGLQIVRDVAALHHAKVSFKKEPDGFAAILQFKDAP